jgi:electron transfer flavoprotein beta subunit
MNIVACIKQVLDTDGPLGIDRTKKSIDARHVPLVINPYDEMAVEEALRLKEASGAGQLTVVTVGDSASEGALRHCLAMGADHAVLLTDAAFVGSDDYITGVILAKAISLMNCSLVLCGARAVDTNGGQVGAVVAEQLGIPMVSAVAKIESLADGRKIIVQRKLERGDREVVEVEFPVLLAIEVGHKPRYPSFPSRVSAQRKAIEYYNAERLGLKPGEVGAVAAKTTILSIAPPKPRAGKLFAPPSNLSPAERMRLLMTGGIQEKKGDTLEGNPKEVAQRLADFLHSQGFLAEVVE